MIKYDINTAEELVAKALSVPTEERKAFLSKNGIDFNNGRMAVASINQSQVIVRDAIIKAIEKIGFEEISLKEFVKNISMAVCQEIWNSNYRRKADWVYKECNYRVSNVILNSEYFWQHLIGLSRISEYIYIDTDRKTIRRDCRSAQRTRAELEVEEYLI